MEKMYRNEEWKPFLFNDCDHSIEKIWVSNFGRVKRRKPHQKEFKLSNFVHANRFKMFFFSKSGGGAGSFYLHRAVAMLFKEQPEGKGFVIHLDHDPDNNHVDNLKWVDRKELAKHQMTNPRRIAGMRNHKNYKLNEEKVKLIKRKIFDPKRKTKMKLIAKQFGISTMQVYRIRSGENWGHVTDF